MLAVRVQTRIWNDQPLHQLSTQDVRVDDLVNIGQGHMPVPDSIRINHDVGTVLALVEASSLVGTNFSFQSVRRQFLLEGQLQLRMARGVATASRMPRRALISADKDVPLKLRHSPNLPATTWGFLIGR